MKLFKRIYGGIPKGYFILDILGSLIWSAFQIGFVEILAGMTDVNSFSAENLPKTALIYGLYILVWEVLEYVADYVNLVSLGYIRCNERIHSFRRTYNIKPHILKQTNTGYIAGLVTQLVGYRKTAYMDVTINLIIAVLYALYFIWRMGTYHIFFGVALFSLMVIGIIFRLIGNKVVRKYKEKAISKESVLDKLFIDSASNISTVQKMKSVEFVDNKMYEAKDETIKAIKKLATVDEFFFCGFKFLMFSYAPVCLLLYAALQDSLTCDVINLFSMVGLISQQFVHIAKSVSVCIQDCNDFLVADNKVESILSKENVRTEEVLNEFKTAEIKDLVYTYKQNGDTVTVSIPSFEVNQGDKICIYGESGQGKTTTLNVISGEIETDKVYIDGERAVNKRLDCVFVSQDTEMLDMSIYDNLVMGADNISVKEILEMIDAVGLRDWFDKLPSGLNTKLGERGSFLSTGQRQRLNLIRGLLQKDKQIYLLDEPTSNVNDEIEERIIDLLNTRLKDKTVLIVSHRPALKRICNKSYEFVEGIMYAR